MNPKILDVLLLAYLAFWLSLIFKTNWKRFNLNRLLILIFVLAITTTVLIQRGIYIDNFEYGLTYLDIEKNSFILEPYSSYRYAISLLLLELILIIAALRIVESVIIVTLVLFAICIDGFISMFDIGGYEPYILLVFLFIPVVTVGIRILYQFLRSPFLKNYNKKINLSIVNLFIFSFLVFHSCLSWIYPTWLEDKYNAGFESGISTAIVENLDWNVLHQWLGNQKPSQFDRYSYNLYSTPYRHDENEEGVYRHFDEDIDNYIKLPPFAGDSKPAAIGLFVEPELSAKTPTVAISLKYSGHGDLIFVAPQTSYTEVMKNFGHFIELPISSQCNCFIGAKESWS